MSDDPAEEPSEKLPEKAPEEAASAPKRKRRKTVAPTTHKLMPRDWLEIVQMARSGVPVATIAETFQVAKASIYAGLKKRRVIIGVYTPSATQIEESSQRQEIIKRIRETKDADYRYTEFLQRQSIKLLMDAQREGRPLATTLDDLKSLKTAMEVVRGGTDNKWRILGLDKENEDTDKELPELPIREMTDAEIIAERDKQLLDDADLEAVEEALVEDGEDDDPEDEDEDDDIGGGDDGR